MTLPSCSDIGRKESRNSEVLAAVHQIWSIMRRRDPANIPEELQTNGYQPAAEEAGLRYVIDADPGITRIEKGGKFIYRDHAGRAVDAAARARVKALVIPPAWTEVWICSRADGHIQATGRDARGRKQYRYHADWNAQRDNDKFTLLLRFARLLPKIRRKVERDLRRRKFDRDKVLATVVYLLETTLIRIGNREYARTNNSFGLTTLQDHHVTFSGGKAKFSFKGKSGKTWKVAVNDRRIARVVRGCQELPGQHLFQYEDEAGELRSVNSDLVNQYLREAAGDNISAKDFRTWAGTVLAAMALSEFAAFDSQAAAKRNVRAAIESVAGRLGNTPTICRKCYVHPEVLDCYLEGALVDTLSQQINTELKGNLKDLSSEEAATLALLHHRLKRPRRSRKSSAQSGAAA